ncbi:MAG: type II toxin-antitoxin system HicA family toxin [Pyrinomonadaceae bacterium]
MSKSGKIREKVLAGNADANIDFNDLCWLLQNYGFNERVKGSHHIFTKSGVDEILNLQPKGKQAKSYQVKQARDVILKYKFGDQDE